VKILMTGATQLQIGVTPKSNNTIQKIDVPASVVEALRAAGHEVDWRRVIPGEDLSSYDVAWCNLAPINSLNGRQGATGLLWTLGSGLPCVGFFDDWATSLVFNGMQSVARNPDAFYKYLIVGGVKGDKTIVKTQYSLKGAEDEIARITEINPTLGKKLRIDRYYSRDTDEGTRPYEYELLEQCFAFRNERWLRGMVPVMPMYAWGDRSIIRNRMKAEMGAIEALDPSPTIYDLLNTTEPLPPERKRREWVLGSIQPHDNWVDRKPHEWEVSYLGSRTAIARNSGERLKTEADVLARYNESWGILSPPYPQSGCGWWRSRFMYSARVRSVLVCDKGEGDPIGSAYRYSMADVEALDDRSLAALAAEQAAQLAPHMGSIETFQEHCDNIVNRALRDDRGWNRDEHVFKTQIEEARTK